MKKAILTFGLFSLVVLTSFTTTENQVQNDTVVSENGGGGTGTGHVINGNKKLDTPDTSTNKPQVNLNVADAGDTKGHVLNGNKKLD